MLAMNSRMLLAVLAASVIFAAAAWSTASSERRSALAERLRRLLASLTDSARNIWHSARARAALGWGIAVAAPWIVACLTLSVWWIEHRLPLPVGVREILGASVVLNVFVAAIIAAVGALLIPGTVKLRVAVGTIAGLVALFSYDIAIQTLDVLFGMSIFPA